MKKFLTLTSFILAFGGVASCKPKEASVAVTNGPNYQDAYIAECVKIPRKVKGGETLDLPTVCRCESQTEGMSDPLVAKYNLKILDIQNRDVGDPKKRDADMDEVFKAWDAERGTPKSELNRIGGSNATSADIAYRSEAVLGCASFGRTERDEAFRQMIKLGMINKEADRQQVLAKMRSRGQDVDELERETRMPDQAAGH